MSYLDGSDQVDVLIWWKTLLKTVWYTEIESWDLLPIGRAYVPWYPGYQNQ